MINGLSNLHGGMILGDKIGFFPLTKTFITLGKVFSGLTKTFNERGKSFSSIRKFLGEPEKCLLVRKICFSVFTKNFYMPEKCFSLRENIFIVLVPKLRLGNAVLEALLL